MPRVAGSTSFRNRDTAALCLDCRKGGVVPRETYCAWWLERFSADECAAMARSIWGDPTAPCHSGDVTTYYNVRLTMKDSDSVDEFYKYTGMDLPEVGEVIKVVRFLRDRPTRARVTYVDARATQPRITAIQIG